jgi:hypothetical protein
MADELDLIIQRLGLHPSANRIKKLMVYACCDRWESDAQVLATTDWPVLIKTLRHQHPTPEHLRARLDALVGTLNKQSDYFPVVNLIAESLAQFYPHPSTAPDPTSDEIPTQVETAAQLCNATPCLNDVPDAIIQALAQEPDSDRIKKLLICAVRNYWETDSQKIANIPIGELIAELRLQQSTLVGLQAMLSRVVQNLSKPVQYRIIADIIVRHLRVLFSDANTSSTAALPVTGADSEMTVPDPLPPAPPPVQQTVIQRAREKTVGKALDLFDLRLEVMKTTNPLRAKILLFSILYYDFNFQPQDWANLKLYSLDGLLRSVLKVCATWEALDTNLRAVARRQPDFEIYVDVITALLKCLKPAYTEAQPYLQQVIKTVSVADATQVVRQHDATVIAINDDATEVDRHQAAPPSEPPYIITDWQKDSAPAAPLAVTQIMA